MVAEAAVAFELARAAREKFGGDAMVDVLAAYGAYLERIGWARARPPRRPDRLHGRREVDPRAARWRQRIGRTFVDLDAAVEQATGETVAELFDRDGEDRFRELRAA